MEGADAAGLAQIIRDTNGELEAFRLAITGFHSMKDLDKKPRGQANDLSGLQRWQDELNSFTRVSRGVLNVAARGAQRVAATPVSTDPDPNPATDPRVRGDDRAGRREPPGDSTSQPNAPGLTPEDNRELAAAGYGGGGNAAGDAAGSPGSAGPLPPSSNADFGRANSAASRAQALGAAMKSDLVDPSAGDVPQDAAAGQGAFGGFAKGPPSPSGGFNIAEPRSPRDFALLAAGPKPFRDAASSLRLRSDGTRLLAKNPDGSERAANSDETARFASLASGLPRAALSDPSLLDPGAGGVTLDQFNRVKSAIEDPKTAKEPNLKDLTTDKTDIKFDKDCQKVSGECNPNAEKDYKKDQNPKGKELAAIWEKINAKFDELAKKSSGPAPRPALGRSRLAGAAARLGAALSGLLNGGFGGGGGFDEGGAEIEKAAVVSLAGADAAPTAAVGGDAPARPARAPARVSPPRHQVPLARWKRDSRAAPAALVGAVLVAVLIVLAIRRRKE